MRHLKFLALCICALTLGRCVKDAEVEVQTDNTQAETTTVGQTTFTFNIQNDTSSKSVEDSGEYDQGIKEEYAVSSVDIYLFDITTSRLATSFSLDSITLSSISTTDLKVSYTSAKVSVDAGIYNVYAVANGSSMYNVATEEQFLAYVDATYADSSLMTNVPGAGFMMTNRASDNLQVSIAENEDKNVSIDLERVVVKVEVAQGYDSFQLTDNDGDSYATIKLTNYSMVNLARNYYLFRHVADLTTFTEPTYSLSTNFGDVSDNNGYVIDPYFFKKIAANAETFDNTVDNYFSQHLSTMSTSPNWSIMPAKDDSSINYCLENTLYQDAQLNGYTTGILFQAKVTPTKVITGTGANDYTTNYTSDIYYCNYKFYDSITTLEACYGTDITGIDDSSTNAELQANYITRLELVGNDFLCYYNYWIKHYDNNDASVMGVMEFGVVRNNHYKITVNSIGGMGTGEPDIDLDRPDEANQTLYVDIDVIPWIVRDQGLVEL